jgi:hypothetical protein
MELGLINYFSDNCPMDLMIVFVNIFLIYRVNQLSTSVKEVNKKVSNGLSEKIHLISSEVSNIKGKLEMMTSE